MNKPKYKLGDIIYDKKCGYTEVIVGIEFSKITNEYMYRTVIIAGNNDGEREWWHETIIDKWSVKTSNILEEQNDRNCGNNRNKKKTN